MSLPDPSSGGGILSTGPISRRRTNGPLRSDRLFVATLLLGLGLRVLGLGWGLPYQRGGLEPTFHPDELWTYEEGRDIYSHQTGHSFTWGGAFYYRISNLAGHAASALGAENQRDRTVLTLILLRSLNVALALTTACLVGWMGARMGGRWVGLLAAALLLSLPAHVLESHYARADILLCLLSTSALACAFKAALGGGRLFLFLGACSAGLATSSMLWGLVAFVPLALLAADTRGKGPWGGRLRSTTRESLVVLAGGAAGYLAGSIETLVFWRAFLAGFRRASVLHGSGPLGIHPRALVDTSLYALGLVGAFSGACGLVGLARRRAPARSVLCPYAAAGIVLLVLKGGLAMRSLILLCPVFALAGAWAIVEGARRAPCKRMGEAVRVAILSAAALLATLQLSLGYVVPMQFAEDARYRAGRWIVRDARPGATVGVTPSFYGDWTYVPRFSPGSPIRLDTLMTRTNYDASGYIDRGLDYIVVSSGTFDDPPSPSAAEFFGRLRQGDSYEHVATIDPSWTPYSLARLLGIGMPGDLLYIQQSFLIFRRIR